MILAISSSRIVLNPSLASQRDRGQYKRARAEHFCPELSEEKIQNKGEL